MENEELIRQILLGRTEMFEQIVMEYQNLVFTVCLNIVKNTYDAENMAQETFLTAYSSLSNFRGGNFKSWLCRIAANKSIDYKRRQSRYFFEDFEDTTVRTGESIEEALVEKEHMQRLEYILSVLPEKYATVIKEFYYNQLTVKEIALCMELPERTVETRLYRAKKLIRERWGEDG